MLAFDLTKRYGDYRLRIAAELGREWLVLLAPSGAGKSLTLDLIAGLVQPDAGWVRLDDTPLFDAARGLDRPIRERRLGYLFQDYALFPHLTVAGNIAYGLPRGAQREEEVTHWLRFFRLEERRNAWPAELSGGQRQRVALARTLANRPQALLLDEPFAALDRQTREVLYDEFLRLRAELQLPVVLVTHDFVEAGLLGDRVLVMDHGQVLESGRKHDIFNRPLRHETARFLGVDNVFAAQVRSVADDGHCTVELPGLTVQLQADARFPVGAHPHLCAHAVDVRLVLDGKPRPNAFSGTVTAIHPHGGTNRLFARIAAGPEIVMLVDSYVLERHAIAVGSPVTAWVPMDKPFLAA